MSEMFHRNAIGMHAHAHADGVGAWVVYGLGCESDNLPAYTVMSDNNVIRNGAGSFGAGFLPAVHQGTLLRTEGAPIQNGARRVIGGKKA